jgi:hypothetical protein
MPEKNENPQPETTGTVVTRERAEIATGSVQGAKALTLFLADKANAVEDPDRDPMDGIIQQVLNADSPAAVLTPIEPLRAQDLVGVPLILAGWELAQSEYDAGSPFYANMAVLTPHAGEAIVNCGHKKVLAQLVKLEQFDEYPYKVVFINRGTSKQGTPMLELTAWKDEDFADGPPF